MLENKDEDIRQVVRKLQDELSTGAFDIVDHWDADPCAIGIARPDNHGVLVYIAAYEDFYFVSLELLSVDEDLPYLQEDEFNNVDFKALASIVKQHLSPSVSTTS